jgi:peptidoglycan/LPS O-acetylase OafA/YrhL
MKDKNRLEFLDSLRGLASIAVVLSHFFIAYGIDTRFKVVTYSPFHFFFDGFAAVTFFFILSGFVLTLSLDREKELNIWSFYAKRIFRIMPSYLVVLFLSLFAYSQYTIIHTKPDSTSWINEFWSKPMPTISFIKELFFIKTDNNADLVFQNWTLNVEMVFSFLIPFLYLTLKKNSIFLFVIFNLVLLIFFNFSVFIFHFSLGMIFAFRQSKIVTFVSGLSKKNKIGLLSLAILLYTYRYTIPMYYYYRYRQFNFLNNDTLIWILTGVGGYLLLLFVFISEKMKIILNTQFIRVIGRLSYAIYLVHGAVLIFVVPRLIVIINNIGIVNTYAVWALALIGLLLVTLLAATILNKYVEIPWVKFGNKMIKKKI